LIHVNIINQTLGWSNNNNEWKIYILFLAGRHFEYEKKFQRIHPKRISRTWRININNNSRWLKSWKRYIYILFFNYYFLLLILIKLFEYQMPPLPCLKGHLEFWVYKYFYSFAFLFLFLLYVNGWEFKYPHWEGNSIAWKPNITLTINAQKLTRISRC